MNSPKTSKLPKHSAPCKSAVARAVYDAVGQKVGMGVFLPHFGASWPLHHARPNVALCIPNAAMASMELICRAE